MLSCRYATEKLLTLQEEILRQSKEIPRNKLLIVDNTGDYSLAVSKIINFLLEQGVIKPK